MEALTWELAPVRVNAVALGLVYTPLLYTVYGPERDAIVQNRAAILPGKRVGTADEVAQVLLMLMTHAYVMGEVVHVDGAGRFVSHRSSNPVYDRWSALSLPLKATHTDQMRRLAEWTFYGLGIRQRTTGHHSL